MKYFTYNQNNSGGYFVGPQYVIVAANSAEQADLFATNLTTFFKDLPDQYNVYFNGIDSNRDCSCCGDRWSQAYNGTDVPMIYGKTDIENYKNFSGRKAFVLLADPLNNSYKIYNQPDDDSDY